MANSKCWTCKGRELKPDSHRNFKTQRKSRKDTVPFSLYTYAGREINKGLCSDSDIGPIPNGGPLEEGPVFGPGDSLVAT